jgi:multidrug efflux pump subunit AcrA (membrane-fusion protein)
MKKTVIITGIVVVVTLIALIIFNKLTTKKDDTANMFTEALSGRFEIAITTTGELIAENSVEIKAPEIMQGRDVRSSNIKITDLIAEGTVVKEGDYIATLDRTEFDNSLKDAKERLVTFQSNLEMAILDTAVTMTNIRDQIANQIHTVEEAEITLRNSKFEPPTTIRQAEINLEKQKRNLDQLRRSYVLRKAQTQSTIRTQKMWVSRIEKRINDYEEVLAGFVIKSPSQGMVIYKRDRFGTKRKVGSMINPIDRVIATIPDLSAMISKAYVSEVEVSKVKQGQEVIITVDAFPVKSYTGSVFTIANIGEKLNNSDTKVFEVQIKVNGTDPELRPSMTTNNKIMIKTIDNVTYIPNECVHTGIDSIPVVYTKNGLKQVVVLGESNDKEIVVEKGVEPGTVLYLTTPSDIDNFKLAGEEFINTIKDRLKERKAQNLRTAASMIK